MPSRRNANERIIVEANVLLWILFLAVFRCSLSLFLSVPLFGGRTVNSRGWRANFSSYRTQQAAYRSPVPLIASGELCYRDADARDNSAFLLAEESTLGEQRTRGHWSAIRALLGCVRVKASLKVTKSIAYALLMAAVNFELITQVPIVAERAGGCLRIAFAREKGIYNVFQFP